jgi:hypothetical protein
MDLWAMPRWARWTALAVVGLGLVSVVAIPFVDATRALPRAVTDQASYTYVLEPSSAREGRLGRVEVVVESGFVVAVDVLSCLSGFDCEAAVSAYVPYEDLMVEVGGSDWTIRRGPPLLEASYDPPDPEGEGRSVRVLDYREG